MTLKYRDSAPLKTQKQQKFIVTDDSGRDSWKCLER